MAEDLLLARSFFLGSATPSQVPVGRMRASKRRTGLEELSGDILDLSLSLTKTCLVSHLTLAPSVM